MKPSKPEPRSYNSPQRSEQAARTRQEIVTVATTLFADRGYANTSVALIAREAGVATQTVYASIGSKKRIVKAVSESLGATARVAELVAAAKTRGTTDARSVLTVSLQVRRRSLERVRELMRALRSAAASGDIDARDAIVAAQQREHDAAARVIATLAELGGLKSDLTPTRAVDIWLTVSSWYAFDTLVRDRNWSGDDVEQWWSESLELLLLEI